MTSRYHGSKISGDKDGHLHCRTIKVKYGLPFCSLVQIMHRKVMSVFSFSTVCWDLEILLP